MDHPLVVGGMHLGTRTTILEVAPRELVVHSPGPLAPAEVEAIGALGEVVAIVAPNNLHHMFLAQAKRAFPEAKLLAPASLSERRREIGADAPLEGSPWAGVLDAVAVEGVPKLGEIAFVHRPSATLVVADLVFNVRPPKPWLTRTLMRFNGGFDRFGFTKMFRSMVTDPRALARSVDAIRDLSFDRIVLAHGDVLESGGRAALDGAFEELRAALDVRV